MSSLNSSGTAVSGSTSEVFALTDEQIVGIGEDAGGVDNGADDELRSANGAAGRVTQTDRRESESQDGRIAKRSASEGGPYKGKETQAGLPVTREAPAWLAERMRDPWHGDEAKELWDGKQKAETEIAAYREAFGTAEDARALKEIYPGGVTDARAAATRARELDAIDAAFYRGDAAARGQLAQRMMREDPAAFREMVEAGVRLLKTVASDEGRAASEDSKEAQANSGTEHVGGTDGRQAEAGAGVPAEIVRAYGEFEKAANLELEKSVGGSIARVMEEALPNLRVSGANGREGAQGTAPLRDRLTGAVREEIEGALKSDRQLGEQVSRILAGRRFDGEARAQVVRLIDARAQQLVPGAVRRVVGSWTSATLGTREKNADAARATQDGVRAEKAAARGEKAGTRREAPVNRARKPDYRRVSDEEILGM